MARTAAVVTGLPGTGPDGGRAIGGRGRATIDLSPGHSGECRLQPIARSRRYGDEPYHLECG